MTPMKHWEKVEKLQRIYKRHKAGSKCRRLALRLLVRLQCGFPHYSGPWTPEEILAREG